MKKIISLVLALVLLMAVSACGEAAITVQEVYKAGENYAALLGDHENVYVVITSDGELLQEEYLSKQCYYSFLGAAYMNMGFEYANFATDHSEYVYFDGICALNVTLTPGGMIDAKENFAVAGMGSFVSSAMLDDTVTVTEENGSVIVTCLSDAADIYVIGEDVVSCEETYTLDAKTREMTSVKTIYTYKDGTVEEGVAIITRDVEMPEGMKTFLAYEQATEMRTVTIVSNPGTENEKTESIQTPKGLQISISPDWSVEEMCTLYADAACTQTFEAEWDVNADLTIYVKWGE